MSRNEIRSIFEDYDKKRAASAQALRDKLITEDGYHHELDKWNRQQRWTERMSAHLEGAQARRDAAAAKVDKIRADFTKPPAGDANAQLLFELRAQRQWARTKDVLDSMDQGKAIGYAVNQIRNAEGHDVVALAQELDSYFTAKGWMSNAFKEQFDAKIPGLAEAEAEHHEAGVEHRRAEAAVRAVERYMAGDGDRNTVEIMCPAESDN